MTCEYIHNTFRSVGHTWSHLGVMTAAGASLANEGSDLFLDCKEGNLPRLVGAVLGVIRVGLELLKFEPLCPVVCTSTPSMRVESVLNFSVIPAMACLVTSSTAGPLLSTGATGLSRSFKTS